MTTVVPAVGIMLPRDLDASRVIEFARRAEALGFAELWVVEDLPFRGGIAQAAVVLAATERIHVGIGILPAVARNVVFATMEIATLATLFPGRLTVGVGHGMPEWMRQAGDWPASPLSALGETLDVMRALLRGEAVTTAGRYVRVDGVRLNDVPTIPPLVLAGVRGPKSLALSGRSADGTVLAEPVTPEYLAAALAQIDTDREHRIVAYNVGAVASTAAAARKLARPALEWIGEPDWAPHIAPLPFADEFREFRASVNREEFARTMPDDWVDALAVVGTAEMARARLEELGRAGAHCVVLIPAGEPFAALEALAETATRIELVETSQT